MSLLDVPDSIGNNTAQSDNEEPPPTLMNPSRAQQVRVRTIKCYAAHFQSWYQGFGEHENIRVNNSEGCWLLGENRIGLVLSKPLFRQLNREIVFQGTARTLVFNEQGMRIGNFILCFENRFERQVLGVIDRFFETDSALHLFRTHHFVYGNEKRILTVSSKRPQPFMYKEIGLMNLKLH
jgi:hypothetical protein